MMYQEFNRLSRNVCDPETYFKEIEPTYMCFEWMTKEMMVAMYWGAKKGAYALWMDGKELCKEKEALKAAWQLGEEYREVWRKKAEAYRAQVEAMMRLG